MKGFEVPDGPLRPDDPHGQLHPPGACRTPILQPIQDTVVLAPHSQLTITALAKWGLVRLGEGNCGDCAVHVEAQSALIGSDAFPQFADPNRFCAQGLPDESLTKLLSLTFVNDSDEGPPRWAFFRFVRQTPTTVRATKAENNR